MNYYSDHSRISNSMLSLLKKCPELYHRRYILGIDDRQPTAEMKLGSLVHALVLEPEEVTSRYACVPKIDRRTKGGKAIYERIVCEHQGKDLIDYEVWDQAMRMAEAVTNHSECKQVFRSACDVELELSYELFDMPCKSKLDLVHQSRQLVLDLKTTSDVSPQAFASSVATFGYHRQAAMYMTAVELLYGVRPRFVFACVSTSEPYIAACHELDAVAIDTGVGEIAQLIEELRTRTEHNDWTSDFAKGVNSIPLPKYYFS